jgi:hypothetical protein
MIRQFKIPIAALTILLISFSVGMTGQSPDYKSNPEVVDDGGGKSSYALGQTKASIGQTAVGLSASPAYNFRAGFLYGAAAGGMAPYSNKLLAISTLQYVKTLLPPPEGVKIDSIVSLVQRSLNALWWVDPYHLNQHLEALTMGGPSAGANEVTQNGSVMLQQGGFQAFPIPPEKKRYGEYVFIRERDAASKIRNLIKNTWYPLPAIEGLKAAAWDMMRADSTLARIKITEAELSHGDPYELQQAYNAMALAELLKNSGRTYYDQIISYYASAWLHAVKAEEKAPAGGPQIASMRDRKPVFGLGQPYPNPSRSTATIAFGIAQECKVALKVYDVSGRLVRTLISEKRPAGYYACEWDNTDDDGVPVTSGSYIYHLVAGPFVARAKLIVIK